MAVDLCAASTSKVSHPRAQLPGDGLGSTVVARSGRRAAAAGGDGDHERPSAVRRRKLAGENGTPLLEQASTSTTRALRRGPLPVLRSVMPPTVTRPSGVSTARAGGEEDEAGPRTDTVGADAFPHADSTTMTRARVTRPTGGCDVALCGDVAFSRDMALSVARRTFRRKVANPGVSFILLVRPPANTASQHARSLEGHRRPRASGGACLLSTPEWSGREWSRRRRLAAPERRDDRLGSGPSIGSFVRLRQGDRGTFLHQSVLRKRLGRRAGERHGEGCVPLRSPRARPDEP